MGCSLTKKVISIKQDKATDSQNEINENGRKDENQRSSSIEKKYKISRQTSIIFIEKVSQNRILDNIMKNLQNKVLKKMELPMESPTTKSPVQGILKYKSGSPSNSRNYSSKKVNFSIEKQDSIDEGQVSLYEKNQINISMNDYYNTYLIISRIHSLVYHIICQQCIIKSLDLQKNIYLNNF